MAIIKFIPAKSKVSYALRYIQNKEKTDEKIISGINCNPETAKQEMTFTKELYEKTEGRQYYHVIQSFKPGEVKPIKAHEIGKELAETKFENYECVVCTHIDKEHVHNHIIVNSVSKETGKMYHCTKHTLREIKHENNRICQREGLSIPIERKNRYFTMEEIKTAEKGISLKFRLMSDIDIAKKNVSSREDFIKRMENRGYKITWTDTRKYITYTMPEGNKFRDRSLPAEYSKEAIENGFRGVEEKKRQSRDVKRVGIEERGTTRTERDFREFFRIEGSNDYSKSKSNDRNRKLYHGKEADGESQKAGRNRQKHITGVNKELRGNSERAKNRERNNDKQSDKGIRRWTRKAKDLSDGDRGQISEVTDRNKGGIEENKRASEAQSKTRIDAYDKSSSGLHNRDYSSDNDIGTMDYSKEQERNKSNAPDDKYAIDDDKAKQINDEIIRTVQKDLPVKEKKEKDREITRSISRTHERGRGR